MRSGRATISFNDLSLFANAFYCVKKRPILLSLMQSLANKYKEVEFPGSAYG